jgi:hypothetical protein
MVYGCRNRGGDGVTCSDCGRGFIISGMVNIIDVKNVRLGVLRVIIIMKPSIVLLVPTLIDTERTAVRFVAKGALVQCVTKLPELAHAEKIMKAVVVIVAAKGNTE